MSNIHITTMDGNEVTAVLHFVIPGTNNQDGVPWRTIAARFYGTTTLPDGDGTLGTISAAEKNSIVAGALVEQVLVFKLATGLPTGAQMDARFTAEQTSFQQAMQARFAHYGLTRG